MPYCVSLKDAFREGKKEAGSKAYNLSLLMSFGFPVPRGFIIKSQCLADIMAKGGLKEKIDQILSETNVDDPAKLSDASKEIRKAILSAELPDNIRNELIGAYVGISEREDISGLNDFARSIMSSGRSETSVAIRASFPNDEMHNSFAGCARASLNVRGKIGFLEALKNVYASAYSENAIYYKEKTGNRGAGTTILVQLMVHPEKSGSFSTANPVTGDKGTEIMEAVWGTGESLALGATVPDRYFISKESRTITAYSVGDKQWMYDEDDFGGGTKKEAVSEKTRAIEVVSHSEIKTVEELARKIEERAGIPQEVEWAISRGRIYILEARPVIFGPEGKEGAPVPEAVACATGAPASHGSAEGRPKIFYDPAGLPQFELGDVLVSKDAIPAMLSATKNVSAVVCEEGGILSNAATLMREFRMPMIVGAKGAITSAGSLGKIYADAAKGKIYPEAAPEAPHEEGAIPDGIDAGTGDASGTLIATKVRVAGEALPDGNIASSDGILVTGNVFSATANGGASAEIAKAAERIHPARMWLRLPKADSTEFGGAATSVHDAVSRGYKNIGAIIPSVYSRSHIESARSILASSGIDPSAFEVGIMIDSPAGAIMACEFAQSGVSVACIDSDALLKNMFGIDNINSVPLGGLELHPAFLQILERCIKSCRKQKMHTAFFGKAAGDPRMIDKLVEFGIDSICVPSENVSMAKFMAARAEKKLLIDILKNRDKFYKKDAQ